jgi:hypothetical protein
VARRLPSEPLPSSHTGRIIGYEISDNYPR